MTCQRAEYICADTLRFTRQLNGSSGGTYCRDDRQNVGSMSWQAECKFKSGARNHLDLQLGLLTSAALLSDS
jgi:hypothetical protein